MNNPTEDDVAKAASMMLNTESAKAIATMTPFVLAIAEVLIRAGMTTEKELQRLAVRHKQAMEQKFEDELRKAARRELEESPGLALMLRLFGAIK